MRLVSASGAKVLADVSEAYAGKLRAGDPPDEQLHAFRIDVEVRDGANGPRPERLFATGSLLLMTDSNSSSPYSLWRSDGTTAGTNLVADIFPGPQSSLVVQLMVSMPWQSCSTMKSPLSHV